MSDATERGWALFLDFDGTLVDIARTPDAVAVPAALHGQLDAIGARLGGALAIVTGRAIASLDGQLGLPGLDVSGMHGLEWRIAGRFVRPDLPDLSDEVRRLSDLFANRPGILVEDKGIGVGLHWRLQPDAEGEARREIAALAARLGPPYRVQDGKAVCEVVPGHAGKGDGIAALLAEPPYRGRRPCFVGDDVTDEHGFEAVEAAGGVAVKVGAGPTAASRRVSSPAGFAAVLAEWAADGLRPEALPDA